MGRRSPGGRIYRHLDERPLVEMTVREPAADLAHRRRGVAKEQPRPHVPALTREARVRSMGRSQPRPRGPPRTGIPLRHRDAEERLARPDEVRGERIRIKPGSTLPLNTKRWFSTSITKKNTY